MADIRIWSVVRTPAEISTNMYAHLTGSESGLAALYNFASDTGNSGSACVDATGGYTGVYHGSCTVADTTGLVQQG